MKKPYLKKQQRFKRYYHDMYTEDINKVALSSDDNKRLQTFGKVRTFPEETPAVKCVKMKCEVYAKQKRHLKYLVKSVKTDCM